MTTYDKPLPPLDDPIQKPFWDAAKGHTFKLQQCASCQAFRWPPAATCPECLTIGGEWTEAPTTGRIWSFAIYDRPYRKEFADDIPYNVALVELDAGPKMISNIVGVQLDDLEIGTEVTVTFDDVTSEATLVKFAPTQQEQEK